MARLHIENVFPNITPDEFWALLLNAQYDKELQPALGVKLRQELERKEDAQKVWRRIRMIPGFPVPAPVQKVLNNVELEYTEESTFHKDRKVLDWSVKPNVMTDRVVARGQVVVTAEGPNVRRVINGEVTVNIFGVGGVIEKLVKDNTERSYEAATRFTMDYLRAGKHKGIPPLA
jgi:hypothetical protein